MLRSLCRAKCLGLKELDSARVGWTPPRSKPIPQEIAANYPIGPENLTDGYIVTGMEIFVQDGLVLQAMAQLIVTSAVRRGACGPSSVIAGYAVNITTWGGIYNLCPRAVIFVLGFSGKRLPALTMDRPTPKGNWVERLKTDITPAHADKLLYACCLCSGLVDSTLYNGENCALY